MKASSNYEFDDTDDLLNYLLDVYRLKNHQRQFDLVEEIDSTLLGNRYRDDGRAEVETNQVVCSPTIDQHIKANIMERRSQRQKSLTNREMYEIEISDDTQE